MVVEVDEDAGKIIQDDDLPKDVQPERRRSERLKKEVHVATSEKNEVIAKKRNLEGNLNLPHHLSDVDNLELDSMAKNMGVVVQKDHFATFDLIKDLELARNCLYSWQKKLNIMHTLAEIVEFDPDNDNSIEVVVTDDESEIEEMPFQKSLKKNQSNTRKLKFSLGGGSKTKKIWACKTPGMSAFL